MQTNRLTEKLEIKRLVSSGTTTGLVVNVWVTVQTIYATLQNQRGNLGVNSTYLGDVYEDTVSFYSRYINLEKKKTRIYWNCKEYEVTNITHVGPRRTEATIIDCIGVS
jgi:head-tail adaptor